MAGKPGGQGSDQVTGTGHGASGGGQDTGRESGGGILERALAAGEFAVTAEIGPPRGASIAPVTHKAALLRDWVHAVNITDNQSATARLAGWAGSLAAIAAGVEPIMQLTCRDRNRIALQSELLAASAMGIPSVLVMTGDHPRHGDHADAKPVFDLDSAQLLRVARTMRDEGLLMSGRELRPPPSWLLGAVTDPSGPADAAADRLARKVEAGAEFVQTQYVFDVPAFAGWMARVAALSLLEHCHILAGVGPVLSQRALHHLAGVPGVHIPEAVADRLQAAGGGSPEEFRAAGERLCAETITELMQIPGVAGLHIMAPGGESSIPSILAMAGLRPRQQAGTAGPATAWPGTGGPGSGAAGTGGPATGGPGTGGPGTGTGGPAHAD